MSAVARGALTGKVGVVTGAGSGIGRAVAIALARQGADVVVADFDAPRMERTVDDILRLRTSDKAMALSTDVRSDSSVRSLAHKAIKAMGHIDIVVNAAGVMLLGKLELISSHDWAWMLETNLLGAVRTAASFLPHMTARGSGQLINVISAGALVSRDPVAIAYETGYAALAAFTERLAEHARESGVVVSLFCIGAKGPRIGQNTRSRGIGRWVGDGTPPEAGRQAADLQAVALLDGVHNPRFLVAGDPSELPALRQRWGRFDAG